MFHRNGRRFDPQQPCGSLRVVAGRRHHMFGMDHGLFIRGNEVSALLHHLCERHLPLTAGPFVPVRLPFALNAYAPLTRTLRHGHSHICRVNVPVCRVVNCPHKILCLHQRIMFFDLCRAQPFIWNTASFRCGRIDHIFVHPRLRLGHAQVSNYGEPGVQSGFRLKRFVKFDRILMNMGCRERHIEQRQKTRRMPR